MVRAALGVVYLLASATANGWNLLQLGLLTSTNSSDDLRNRTEAGPRDRGGPSRPDPGLGSNKTWDWWSVAWDGAYHYVGNSWWIKMWVRMLLQVAENGISYCGTLCASIGLAARWSYWLLTGMVLVFLLQLLVWTSTWVIHPTWIHSRALWRYCQGTGTWSDVTRLQGQRPFIPVWKGPGTGTPWSALYIQREVRGRGPNQKPFDLLVADGAAVTRLRHGTIRGRTNRHGFLCQCEEVRASSQSIPPSPHRDCQLRCPLVRSRPLRRPRSCAGAHQGQRNGPAGPGGQPAGTGRKRALGTVRGDHKFLRDTLVPLFRPQHGKMRPSLVLVSVVPVLPYEASFSPGARRRVPGPKTRRF